MESVLNKVELNMEAQTITLIVKVSSEGNTGLFEYPVTVQEFYNKQSELPEGSSIFEILFALANDKVK